MIYFGFAIIVLFSLFAYARSKQSASICESKSCIRCGRRPTLLEIRFWLIIYYRFSVKRSLNSRLWHSNSSYLVTQLGQLPTVLSIHNLPTEEFPTFLPSLITQVPNPICPEVDTAELTWVTNEISPAGTWKIAHLVNQGLPTSNFYLLNEATQQIIDQLVPSNKLFGAAISWLEMSASSNVRNVPDILIKTHHGVTNAKWRLHVPLYTSENIAQKLYIVVNGKKHFWTEPFTIDDSFQHSVHFSGDDSAGSRIVLILDIWNSNLTEQERKEIDFISKWAI